MHKTFCSNAGLPGSFTKALSYDEQIQFLIDKYNKMADVINNLKIDVDISDVVKYIPQTGFSELQKQQATENIGAVSTISKQILNEDEQMNARENINAMEYEPKDDFVKAGGAVVYDENFTNILPNTNLATVAYCEPGRYYCEDITGITGFSAAMPFEMEVFKVNSNLVRRYFQYDNGRKYVQEVELNPLKFYSIVDFGGFNVSYLLQDLTEVQKAQARENIGAGTSNITSGDISAQINNNSVKFSGAQDLTEDQKAQARANIGAGTGSGSAENAVLYTAQELTDGQKTQARNNIGAGTSNITSNDISTEIDNNSVKFSGAQSLTEEQKLQARNNIGIETVVSLIPTSIAIPPNDTYIDSTKSSLKYYKIGNIIFMTGILRTKIGASEDWKDTRITVPIPDNPCILYGYSTYKNLRCMINAQGQLRIYINPDFNGEDFYISTMYTVNQ